jgi:hypothetical protein
MSSSKELEIYEARTPLKLKVSTMSVFDTYSTSKENVPFYFLSSTHPRHIYGVKDVFMHAVMINKMS